MTKMSKWSYRTILLAMVSTLLLAVGAMPANAAAATSVSVGSSPSVLAYTTINDPVVGKNIAISYSPEFNNHQQNSVNVTTFRVCYSMTGEGWTYFKPQIAIQGTVLLEYDYEVMASGTCKTYSLNRTFQASPGSELFRIIGVLGGMGGPSGVTVGGFNR